MQAVKAAAACLCIATAADASDCWIATNFEGRGAMSHQDYTFAEDELADGMLVCFGEGQEMVSGNDLQFVRMGRSTLIGWSSNGLGLETVNTFQIDRQRNKLLVTRSRIGTATVTSALPDLAGAFVGDAVPAP